MSLNVLPALEPYSGVNELECVHSGVGEFECDTSTGSIQWRE